MVTFRFYLVSVVAFFLALAVGVVVGSVLDEGIARGLRERLDRVERNLDETGSVIDDKNDRIGELEDFSRAVAPFAVQGRLPDTSTLVVVEPGIGNEPVEDAVARLREAGSFVPGIVWFEPSWSLEDEADLGRFAEIVGGGTASVEELHDLAIRAMMAGGSDAGTSDGAVSTTTVTAGSFPSEATPVDVFSSPVLGRLQEAGFVRVVPLGGGDAQPIGRRVALVAVTGSDSKLGVRGSAAVGAAATAGKLGHPAVLGEVFDRRSTEPRGEIVSGAVETVEVPFTTVDDLEMVAGRVATVLGLEQGRDGVVGRYGFGEGVDGVLPPWQGR